MVRRARHPSPARSRPARSSWPRSRPRSRTSLRRAPAHRPAREQGTRAPGAALGLLGHAELDLRGLARDHLDLARLAGGALAVAPVEAAQRLGVELPATWAQALERHRAALGELGLRIDGLALRQRIEVLGAHQGRSGGLAGLRGDLDLDLAGGQDLDVDARARLAQADLHRLGPGRLAIPGVDMDLEVDAALDAAQRVAPVLVGLRPALIQAGRGIEHHAPAVAAGGDDADRARAAHAFAAAAALALGPDLRARDGL